MSLDLPCAQRAGVAGSFEISRTATCNMQEPSLWRGIALAAFGLQRRRTVQDPSHWRGIIVPPPCYSESSGRLAHEFSSGTPKASDWVDCRRYSIADYEVSFWFAMISRHDHHHHHRHEHDHHHDHDRRRHLFYHHIRVIRSSPSPLLMHPHRTAGILMAFGRHPGLHPRPCPASGGANRPRRPERGTCSTNIGIMGKSHVAVAKRFSGSKTERANV